MTMRTAFQCVACWLLLIAVTSAETGPETMNRLLDESGTRGGMVAMIGSDDDGQIARVFGQNPNMTLMILDRDPAIVSALRSFLQSLDNSLYGRVSVAQLTGDRLPFADNTLNVVVVEQADSGNQVLQAEVQRICVPGGLICVRDGDQITASSTKPTPNDIDSWSHFLHDATNNAVAADEQVGPPRSLQWVAPPLWLRSHETPSGIQASVTDDGRIFYIFDDGLIGITDERLPDRWSLVARDAFNGRLLWRKPLDSWGWREWSRDRWAEKDWTELRAGRTDVPNENHRRLVASGDRLFSTLAYNGPTVMIDATTGDVITPIEDSDHTKEILVAEDTVLIYAGASTFDAVNRRGGESDLPNRLIAADAKTGSVRWMKPVPTLQQLMLAINNGRIIYKATDQLFALDLQSGEPLWQIKPERKSSGTMGAIDNVVLLAGSGGWLDAYDANSGRLIWSQQAPSPSGAETQDLFVIDGLAYRGAASVTIDPNDPTKMKVGGKSDSAMVVGYDLHTGEEKQRVIAESIRSPEHHHRCYRNKATSQYILTAMEGIEMVDVDGTGQHSQNNFLRGSCRYGIMPANGMLYVPADQCFCEPGAKVLGFTAVGPEPKTPIVPVADDQRLIKGPAFEAINKTTRPWPLEFDWPTFRHDAARTGSTRSPGPANLDTQWEAKLGGRLTQPTLVGNTLYIAAIDRHTVYAIDAATGETQWAFTAGGRIDSPPTVYQGLVLFGSSDGCVYGVRATDGQLAWKFLAAPVDQRIGAFDQFESRWPVHGSVLVNDGTVYFSAGRSTYLDGGIRFYGLNPMSGEIKYQSVISGPHPDDGGEREKSFYITGANSDVLVAEDGFIYMRQKKLTPELQEIEVPILSTKGEQDVGMHMFSTSGLLDDSWYNRAFWMYAERWPGFQLANQAPKTGQLLVRDDERTYAVRAFYHRNVHSPMFFPGKEGYLLFADRNDNEPQIVGEEGARTPIEWLPQSDYSRARGNEMRKLNTPAFGLDKMIGYTRAEPTEWQEWTPIRVRAMVKTADRLFIAGPPDDFDESDPFASFEGRNGGRLAVLSTVDGKLLAETPLDTEPVFDGLIASGKKLYMSTRDGRVICFGDER